MEENNKKKSFKIIISLVLVVVVLSALLFAFLYMKQYFNNNNKEWFTPSPINSTKLYIYRWKINNYDISVSKNKLSKQEIEDSKIEEVGVYNAKTDNLEYYTHDEDVIVLKDGNEYYLYNYNTNKAKQLFFEDENIINVEIISNDVGPVGLISHIDNETIYFKYYSLKNNKYIYDFDYSYEQSVGNTTYVSYNKLLEQKENKYIYEVGVFNTNTEQKEMMENFEINEEEAAYFYKVFANEENNIKYWVLCEISGKAKNVYNAEKNRILENIGSIEYDVGNENIAVSSKDNNYFSVYNQKGELVKKSKEYEEVYTIVENYAIVLDKEQNLKLVDFNDNLVEQLMKWDENRYTFYSGYFSKDEEPYGVHAVVVDSEKEAGIEEGAAIDYCYNVDTKKLEKYLLKEF